MAMTVAKIGGRPKTEFLLLPFGPVRAPEAAAGAGEFMFTPALARQAVACFQALGRGLAIDYEHQSMPRMNQRADKLAPAAGWIGGMEVRPTGLWATRVEWTPQARIWIASGQYRYFSPVIFWTDERRSGVRALGPVALTNNPAINGAQALVASAGGPACTCGPYLVAADAPPTPEQTPNPGPSSGDGSLNRPKWVPTNGGPRMDELREVAQALELQPDATIDEMLAVIAALKEAAGVTDNKTVGQSKPHSASVLSRADVLREWHASPELRREFGCDFDTFTAWRTNAAAGNCSVVGRSAAS